MKTVYEYQGLDQLYDEASAYLVLERREERATDLIVESANSVSDAGNACEQYDSDANKAEDFTTKHYFIKREFVDEIVPLPETRMM